MDNNTTTVVPSYQSPPPSADELALAAQTAEQNKQATQADARMDTARLMAIYGTRLVLGGQTVEAPVSPLLNSSRSGFGPPLALM